MCESGSDDTLFLQGVFITAFRTLYTFFVEKGVCVVCYSRNWDQYLKCFDTFDCKFPSPSPLGWGFVLIYSGILLCLMFIITMVTGVDICCCHGDQRLQISLVIIPCSLSLSFPFLLFLRGGQSLALSHCLLLLVLLKIAQGSEGWEELCDFWLSIRFVGALGLGVWPSQDSLPFSCFLFP